MSTYYIGGMPVTDELYHHGILGQKWGVRRYQNPDGTLTPAGKARYGKDKGDMDYIETSIVNRMDDLAKKATYNEDMARAIMDNKVSRILTPDIAAMYVLRANKFLDQMNAGGKLLESYRLMSQKTQDRLRDDTIYNFQIRNALKNAASVNMNDIDRKKFKKDAKAYRFNWWEQTGNL